MKKFFRKRIIPAIITISMLAVLAACGEEKVNPNKPSSSGDKSGTGSNSAIVYNKPSSTIGANGKDYSDYDPYADIEKYRGKTVKFATWIDHSATEGAVPIASFEKKYGIKVELVYCSQSNYLSELLALIESGNSPDIFVENGDFPATLQVAQDFSCTGIDLNEPIWSQQYIKANRVGSKIYGVNTVNSPWNSAYLCFYNRDLMEENGIKTPTEYYEEGNWTWETMTTVMQQVDSLGSEYKGGVLSEHYAFLTSAGALPVTYDPDAGKFTKNTGSDGYANALKFIATLRKSGLDTGGAEDFNGGKIGIVVKDAYGLKKTGYYRHMDALDIGFVPMPNVDTNTPAKPGYHMRNYGIVKGAKNPQAAGLFLRYFLDPANYDLENTFISNEAGQFYFDLLKANNESGVDFNFSYFGVGTVIGYKGRNFGYVPNYQDPAQISTFISSEDNIIQNGVDKSNKLLAQMK